MKVGSYVESYSHECQLGPMLWFCALNRLCTTIESKKATPKRNLMESLAVLL